MYARYETTAPRPLPRSISPAFLGSGSAESFHHVFANRNEIDPQNLVGYTNTNLVKSVLQNTGVCFMNVDGTGIDIQDIIPMNNGAASVDGSLDGKFEMRWFDGGKYTYAYYYDPLYDPDSPGGEDELDYAGWSDDEINMFPFVGGKTFDPGQWFLVKPGSSVTKPQIQIAGSLVTSDASRPVYAMTLAKNVLQSTGNPFPVPVDIQAIIPMDGEKTSGLDGKFEMRWFDGGKYTYAYFYDPLYDPDSPGGEDELDYAGWSDDEINMFPFVGGKTFLPGEGFLVKPGSSVANPKLAFPNPLYHE